MGREDRDELTAKEKAALDRKMEQIKPKLVKAIKQYDDLISQYAELQERQRPELKEERLKDTLFEAYRKSNRTLEEILAYMADDCENDH